MTKKFIFSLFALTVILLPSFASAASSTYTAPTIPYWATNGLVSCTGNGTTPCTSLNDLVNTAENIIYFAITIALLVIMPFLFVWGGIMFMFSQGKPEGIGKARKILTGAVIGLCIVLGAWLIVNTLVKVLGISSYVGGFPG